MVNVGGLVQFGINEFGCLVLWVDSPEPVIDIVDHNLAAGYGTGHCFGNPVVHVSLKDHNVTVGMKALIGGVDGQATTDHGEVADYDMVLEVTLLLTKANPTSASKGRPAT